MLSVHTRHNSNRAKQFETPLEPRMLEHCRPCFRATSETHTTYCYSPHPREALSLDSTPSRSMSSQSANCSEDCTETSWI